MDLKQKEMQHLGGFEILKETLKMMNKNRKMFGMASLVFIHPLNYFLESLMGTLIEVLRNLHEYGNISHLFYHTWSFFWPFNVFCIVFLFGSSIFATAGLSLTVAAVYTGRETTINDTFSIVTKVWKRVFVTFLSSLLVVLAYHVIAGFAMLLLVWISSMKFDRTSFVVLLVFYLVGLLYLLLVFQLAGVVSALEDLCGFKAMEKSRLLLKGKMASATVVALAIWSTFGILVWLDSVVKKMLFSPSVSIVMMYVPISLSMLLLILVFLLVKLVLETVLYFVCKSYHGEGMDYMLALSCQDHLPITSSEC